MLTWENLNVGSSVVTSVDKELELFAAFSRHISSILLLGSCITLRNRASTGLQHQRSNAANGTPAFVKLATRVARVTPMESTHSIGAFNLVARCGTKRSAHARAALGAFHLRKKQARCGTTRRSSRGPPEPVTEEKSKKIKVKTANLRFGRT